MPTYDYRCPNGHDFEHFYRKISDAAHELACPVCGAVATRRVSGGAGLVFKGSGFYLTDYGKNAHRRSGAGADGSGSGESKGESGGDGKPPAKTDSPKPESAPTSAKPETSGGGSTKSDAGKSADVKPSSGKASGGDAK